MGAIVTEVREGHSSCNHPEMPCLTDDAFYGRKVDKASIVCQYQKMQEKSTFRGSWLRIALIAILLACVVTALSMSAAHIHKDRQSEPIGHCSFCMAAAQLVSGVAVVVVGLLLQLVTRRANNPLEQVVFVASQERHVYRVRPPPVY